ncbi:hypothetical protein ABPG75_004673 [Micractinium tetrahymenae]
MAPVPSRARAPARVCLSAGTGPHGPLQLVQLVRLMTSPAPHSMARKAALAACMLALAAGAVAQLSCTPSSMELQYVMPQGCEDPIAKCLTSMHIDLSGSCSIKITSLQSHGSHTPAMWASDPALMAQTNYVECPAEGAEIAAEAGCEDKLEAVRRAIIKGLASFVYGLDEYGEFNYEIEVPDLDFFPGKLIVKRINALNLVYAITTTDVVPADLVQDDDITPIYEVPDCAALGHNNPLYDARPLCLGNLDAHGPCPDNSYGECRGGEACQGGEHARPRGHMATWRDGPRWCACHRRSCAAEPHGLRPLLCPSAGVMVLEDGTVNAYNHKVKAFKVCAWCPGGTAGDGYGCTTCEAGQYSVVGGYCEDCPPGTSSNAGSSVCLPCPAGSYSDTPGAMECTQCPEDTYSWIPGATACLRCTNGLLEACFGGAGGCAALPADQTPLSSQATHVVAVSSVTGVDGACRLTHANPDNEIKALTKCSSWGDTLQLAFTVYGDCSIQISPISDPSCSDTTDTSTYEYGAIQQRAYFYQDPASFGSYKISSLLATGNGVINWLCVRRSLMLSISAAAGSDLTTSWFAATIDAKEGQTNYLIRDKPGQWTQRSAPPP